MRLPLVLLTVFLWLLLGWWYYTDQCECCSKSMATAVPAKVDKVLGPLLFNYGKPEAITGPGWGAISDSITTNLGDNQILEIVGHYRANEVNNTTFENLGLARANEIRKLFPKIPDDRIKLVGKLIDGDIADKANPFESAEFGLRIQTDNIKEVEDKALIYFPFNSTNKINSAEIEKYLDDVAAQVIKSKQSVALTGHTDDVGNDASNLALGQRRADIIKAYLISKGVPNAQINATSKGEAAPVVPNDTEQNRAQNRRTELQIIK